MKIQILLPFSGKSGGTIALFEIGNAFRQLGHETVITVPIINCGFKDSRIWNIYQGAKSSLSDILKKYQQWFPYPELVKTVPYLSPKLPDRFDLTILGSWPLAYLYRNYKHPEKLFYWIQGLETWQDANIKVHKTYQLKVHKAVTTEWLQIQIKPELSNTLLPIIPLGVHSRFKQGKKRVFNPPWKILCCFHELKQAQFYVALGIISKLRKLGHKIELTIVSPINIDQVVDAEMHINPSPAQLVKIYSNQHFFVYPTNTDGWGMMVSEAMAAGVITISNPIGFSHDYGKHLNNMIIPAESTTNAYVKEIHSALANPDRLSDIADNAMKTVSALSWKKTAIKLISTY